MARWLHVTAAAVFWCSPARGQWKVVFLEPPEVQASQGFAATGVMQGGHVQMPDGNYHPALWTGRAEFTDLIAPGFFTGVVSGMDGVAQVGKLASFSIGGRAILWSGGDPEDYTDLTPPGGQYGLSHAHAIHGNQQAGTVSYLPTGYDHAARWSGTAASFVDMHPPICRWSEALATDGVRQGGWGQFPTINYQLHAILWQGTGESFVDMNPTGARESRIAGMADGVQVGWALFGSQERAIVWRGTPESAVQVIPPGVSTTRFNATTGKIHAGYTSFTGTAQAGVWYDDDLGNFINLHSFLGPGFYASNAYGISIQNGRIHVCGSGARPGEREQAILWVGELKDDTPPHRVPRKASHK